MSDAFVFEDIIVSEGSIISTPSFQGMSYILTFSYTNNARQSGSIEITINNEKTLTDYSAIGKFTMGTGLSLNGSRTIPLQIPFSIYPTYTTVNIGCTLANNSAVVIMAKPVVIKSLANLSEANQLLNKNVIVAAPDQTNNKPLTFNVGTGGVVLISSAFVVLLVMVYRQWSKSSDKLKDGKV